MAEIKIGIVGCAGRMGQTLARLVHQSEGFALAGGTEAAGHAAGGADMDDGLCSLDGEGWVSVAQWVMRECGARWHHLGGRHTGNCGGHDGDTVRLLAPTESDCWNYEGLDLP